MLGGGDQFQVGKQRRNTAVAAGIERQGCQQAQGLGWLPREQQQLGQIGTDRKIVRAIHRGTGEQGDGLLGAARLVGLERLLPDGVAVQGDEAGEGGAESAVRLGAVDGVRDLAVQEELHRRYAGHAVFAGEAADLVGIGHHQEKAAAIVASQVHQTRHQHQAGAGLGRPKMHQHQALA